MNDSDTSKPVVRTGELLSHSQLTGKFYIVTKWLEMGISGGTQRIEALEKHEATDEEVADWPIPEDILV